MTETLKRTDVHRPSAIEPDEYTFVGHEHVEGYGLEALAFLQAERARIREHMAQTGGTYSKHEHGGNCGVCGNVLAIYTLLFHHAPTNSYVRLGQICAEKMFHSDFGATLFRRNALNARDFVAGKKKAVALLTDHNADAAWEIFEAEPVLAFEESTVRDLVSKLVKYGDLSPKQWTFLAGLLDRIVRRPMILAQRAAEAEAAAPVPVTTERITVEGEVLSFRTEDGFRGPVVKGLVKTAPGYKLWGTIPAAFLPVERGAKVCFTARVSPAPNDAKFGFWKNPRA